MLDDSFLPPGYRLQVVFGTVDLDPGDPEVGPRPDLQTVPLCWTLRTDGGLLISEGVKETDHEWVDRNNSPSIDLLRVIVDDHDRRAVTLYLHEMIGL